MRALTLMFGMFVMGCDCYVAAGLLPQLSADFGASLAVLGQSATLFDLVYVLAAPAFALTLVEASAKRVVLGALLVVVASNVLAVIAHGAGAYFVSRMCAALGVGLFVPIAAVHGADLAGRWGAGLVWGAHSAGVVLGVPAALALAQRLGWRAASVFVAVCGALALLVGSVTTFPERRATAAKSLTVLTRPGVALTLVVTLLTATGSLGLYVYSAAVCSMADSSFGIAAWSMGGLVGSFACGGIVQCSGSPRRAMFVVLGGLALALLIVGLAPSRVVTYALWGAMGWAVVPLQQQVLSELAPDDEIALAALNGSALGLGSALGAALGGGALALGLMAAHLPFAAAAIVLGALIVQLAPDGRRRREVLA